MTTEESSENDYGDIDLVNRGHSLSVYVIGLVLPLQFLFTYQYSNPVETILSGFVTGLLAVVYWRSTAAVQREGRLLRVLAHPIVRVVYIIIGAVGASIGLTVAVNHPRNLLIVVGLFALMIGFVYWTIRRPSA